MLNVKTTAQFETDYRRMLRTGQSAAPLWAVVRILVSQEAIPDEYRDHELGGRWAGVRDIHVEADWLLLYFVSGHDLVLVRTGTHRELFR